MKRSIVLLIASRPSQFDDARKALEPLTDPLLVTLANAPYDDEPETDEERAAVSEGRAALDAGDYLTLDEVRREIGL